MTDRSKIIRHPDITYNELDVRASRLRGVANTLNEIADELEQVNQIIFEMFPDDMKKTKGTP